MRFLFLWIGKTRNPAAAQWTEDYLRRIARFARVAGEAVDARQGEAGLLRRASRGERRLILLEPGGRAMDSAALAEFLRRSFASDSREMVFAIGGPEGFSAVARDVAESRLSLSAMTYSHELARVMLLEQIYRALTLLHHHPYPR